VCQNENFVFLLVFTFLYRSSCRLQIYCGSVTWNFRAANAP